MLLLLLLIVIIQLVILYWLAKKNTDFLYKIINLICLRKRNLSNWLFAFILLPGTLIHELAHFFMAIILFVKVEDMNIFPSQDGKHNLIMGSVTYHKTDPLRGLLIGIAPIIVVLIIFVIFYQVKIFPHSNLWLNILIIYLIFNLSVSMFSSKQDLINLIEVIGIFVSTTIIGAGVIWFLQVDIYNLSRSLQIPNFVENFFDNFLVATVWALSLSLIIHTAIFIIYGIIKFFLIKL